MAPTSQTAWGPKDLEGRGKYSLMNCRQQRKISSKNCMTEPQVKTVVCNSVRKTMTGAGDRVPRTGGRHCICRHSPGALGSAQGGRAVSSSVKEEKEAVLMETVTWILRSLNCRKAWSLIEKPEKNQTQNNNNKTKQKQNQNKPKKPNKTTKP